MKSHTVTRLLLSAALGVPLLAVRAAAHPGHAGHDIDPLIITTHPDAVRLLLAAVVTSTALLVTRGVFGRLP